MTDSTINKRIERIIEESLAFEYEDAKKAGMLGYMARSLVQATLPHTDPKTAYFERTNGLVTLSITGKPTVGLPYGSVPRSLLAWICTEAVLTGSQELSLGRSQAEFLDKLNMASNGNYIRSLKKQSQRLFSSMISLSAESGNDIGIENVLVAKRAFLFWNTKNPEERSLWDSTLTLTAEFFEEVTRSPVPVDLRVLNALRQSPMSMDIYTWACYRQYLMKVSGHGIVHIPWVALMRQFGSSHGNKISASGDPKEIEAKANQALRNFKHAFLKRLREVAVFYPELGEAATDTGTVLQLKSVRLHIAPEMKNKIKV